MITEDMLVNYKELLAAQTAANEAVKWAKIEMEDSAGENDDVTVDGLRARWKSGRKKTDHKAAADGVDIAIVEKFTTTKTTSSTAWAKVTKAAKVDTAPFTVQSPPVFVIEVVK